MTKEKSKRYRLTAYSAPWTTPSIATFFFSSYCNSVVHASVGGESKSIGLSKSTCLIELIYVAATPVCFPERPEHTNLITSGFAIPASAVQGSLLHLINEADQRWPARCLRAHRSAAGR